MVGPGVERLAEEVYSLFPEAKVTILSSDILNNPIQIATTIQSIEAGEVDIIIGTQMVAKGHHFPKLTCVAVIDGDLGLSGGDLRAGERTFQMLSQVAGRSGREKQAGSVYIQTAEPEHPAIVALKSRQRDEYLRLELEKKLARAAALKAAQEEINRMGYIDYGSGGGLDPSLNDPVTGEYTGASKQDYDTPD